MVCIIIRILRPDISKGVTFGIGVFHPPLEARSGAFAEVKLKFVLKIVKTPSVLRGELMESVFSTLPWRPEVVLLLR